LLCIRWKSDIEDILDQISAVNIWG